MIELLIKPCYIASVQVHHQQNSAHMWTLLTSIMHNIHKQTKHMHKTVCTRHSLRLSEGLGTRLMCTYKNNVRVELAVHVGCTRYCCPSIYTF